MKRKIFISLILLSMFFFNSLFFFAESKILMINESSDYLYKFIQPKPFLGIILIFSFLIVINLRIKRILKNISCIIIIVLWVLNGRIIAFKEAPDSKIIVSWYYLINDTYTLCDGTSDCEIELYTNTQIEYLSFWRIRVKNKNIDETFWIGPFISKEAKNIINFMN